MSNGNNKGTTQTTESKGSSEIERLKADVEALRGSVVELALLVLPYHLRNYCGCGKLACLTSTATTPGSSELSVHHLCEDCKLPTGCTEARRVSLSPADRDTVRIANRVGLYRPTA
jgi:hypothetical protein